MPRLDHIDLSVSDLTRSVRFYDTVLTALGFQRVSDDSTVVWRGQDIEIGIRASTESEPALGFNRYRVGLHHLAFRAENRAEVDRFYKFLTGHTVKILDAPAEYPEYGADYYAMFFADPDGMKLELVHRTLPGLPSL